MGIWDIYDLKHKNYNEVWQALPGMIARLYIPWWSELELVTFPM